MSWRTYWTSLIVSIAVIAAVLFVAVWVINPYGNLPYSPSLDRAPIATNQRYSYPSIARDPAFDSLVIGTSTARLLKPGILNEGFGAHFANLSLNSGTPYEQVRLGTLFAKNHPGQRVLIVGLDTVWCDVGASEKYTFRAFPEWMYDANPWNDLPNMIEFRTFEDTVRQAGYLIGVRSGRYGRDGYADFLPPLKKYDLARARENIYGPAGPALRTVSSSPNRSQRFDRQKWAFESHRLLDELLGAVPRNAKKVLAFVPYHKHLHGLPNTEQGAKWDECKKRISAIARRHPNTTVLDFMIDSPITSLDTNYWDPLHYTNEVADRFAKLIAGGAKGEPATNGEYRILVP